MHIQDEGEAQRLVDTLRGWMEEDESTDPWIYFKGRGKAPLSPKFNVVMYRNGKGHFKVVTTDEHTLVRLVNGQGWSDGRTYRVDIDDAGIGCPIGGVLIGAYDHLGKRFLSQEIPVFEFQGSLFETRHYLEVARDLSIGILDGLGYPPGETVVYLCTGYIHNLTKEALREAGYEVQVTEIGPPLQDLLENALKVTLLQEYGFSGFYDPKVDDPRRGFMRAMRWARKDPDRLRFCKTAWKVFNPPG
jgi:hypothetical protein